MMKAQAVKLLLILFSPVFCHLELLYPSTLASTLCCPYIWKHVQNYSGKLCSSFHGVSSESISK